jgi:hypothetical protein
LGEFFHVSPFSFDEADYWEFSYIFKKQQSTLQERQRAQELADSGQQDISSLLGPK